MPHIHTSAVSESSFHLQLTVIRAMKTYKKHTKNDLFSHPFAVQFRAHNSSGTILLVLQWQIQMQGLSQSQCGHERLARCLEPTVNLLYTFSLALEEGGGLVCFGTCY